MYRTGFHGNFRSSPGPGGIPPKIPSLAPSLDFGDSCLADQRMRARGRSTTYASTRSSGAAVMEPCARSQ